MTAVSVPVPPTALADPPLQRLLRLDAAATGAAGLLGLVLPTSVFGTTPGWVARAVGAVLLLVAVDLAVAARWSGHRLRLATTVCADLALGWVVATAAVLALVDLPAAGREVLVAVGVVTGASALAELRALRR